MEHTFGGFLASRRKQKGLTQKELAGLLFVSESTVGKWEQNRANPDITVIPTLAEILGVTTHELITASIDTAQRENNKRAKKWHNLTVGWNLFFMIVYAITLLTCFVCNLATVRTLSWFWIVFTALLLSASVTTFPQYIKKCKLLIVSITQLICLIVLLGVCCIYTNGDWFVVAVFPILFSFVLIFLPLYISKYNLNNFIKKHKALLCALIDFALLIAMLYIIEDFSISKHYTTTKWATGFALPISCYGLIIVLALIGFLQYIKVNKLFKASFVALVLTIVCPATQVLLDNLSFKIWKMEKPTTYLPNLNSWNSTYINNNIRLIVMASLALLAIVFVALGIIKNKKGNN